MKDQSYLLGDISVALQGRNDLYLREVKLHSCPASEQIKSWMRDEHCEQKVMVLLRHRSGYFIERWSKGPGKIYQDASDSHLCNSFLLKNETQTPSEIERDNW